MLLAPVTLIRQNNCSSGLFSIIANEPDEMFEFGSGHNLHGAKAIESEKRKQYYSDAEI